MEQLKCAEDVIGKTITDIREWGHQLFVFLDGGSFFIVINDGYDETDLVVDSDEFNLLPNRFNYRDLARLGFISEEEADMFEAEVETEREKVREEKEKAFLIALLDKYPEVLDA